jgi:hypothetical protein
VFFAIGEVPELKELTIKTELELLDDAKKLISMTVI